MQQHWHAYAYTGKAYKDGEARDGRAPENFPPFLVEDWLRKPRKLIVSTFTDIEAAVEWLGFGYRDLPPNDVAAFPIEDRLSYARKRMGEDVGKDVTPAWYTGGQYVSRALVACPRPKRHQYAEDSPPPCPDPVS